MTGPIHVLCAECHRFAHELQEALRSDLQQLRAHFHATAKAARREPDEFLQHWLLSLARMPEDEFDSLQCAYYPRVSEVRRRWKQHGTLSGHPVPRAGWRGAFIVDVARRAYGAFPKGPRQGER